MGKLTSQRSASKRYQPPAPLPGCYTVAELTGAIELQAHRSAAPVVKHLEVCQACATKVAVIKSSPTMHQ